MADPMVLTFAELAFLLQPYPDRATVVRERLRLTPAAGSEVVAAAGVASLLARALCTLTPEGVRPTDRIVVVAAALSTADTYTEAVTWTGDRPVLMHIFSSRTVRIGLVPAAFGLYTVEPLDATVPLADPVLRLLDATAAGPKGAVAVRSNSGGREVSIAVARDEAGTWFVSDSEHSPNRGIPSTRDGATARLTELLGPWAPRAGA